MALSGLFHLLLLLTIKAAATKIFVRFTHCNLRSFKLNKREGGLRLLLEDRNFNAHNDWTAYHLQQQRKLAMSKESTKPTQTNSTSWVAFLKKLNFIRNFSSSSSSNANGKETPSFFQKFFGPKEIPKRYSGAWIAEMALLCTVFAITGSSTMFLVRPFMHKTLQVEGTLMEGPWSYRLAYITCIMPVYSVVLVLVGTVFGRHHYFKNFVFKMWSRFIPTSLRNRLKS